MNPANRPRVMFLSEMCLLDRNSGAAIEMLDWLRLLARSGFEVSSVSMSLFDGQHEYPAGSEIAQQLGAPEHIGKRIRLARDGIEHNIFHTGTSLATRVSPDLTRGFLNAAAEDIRRVRPDIIIGYGSANLVPLRALARQQGARCVFYLANDSYTEARRNCFGEIDAIVTPSKALADLYRDRLGFDCRVIGNYIPAFSGMTRPSRQTLEDRRRTGFVTMVNPSLVKGGLHFLQIAAAMQKSAPATTFLAIESRGTRAELERLVPNTARLSNIWWLPRQADMHRLFHRTSVLLVPSLWFEAAGRVVPEAQLFGVPVVAYRVGALAEQVGNGGTLLDVPERLVGRMADLPEPAEVAPWVTAIRRTLQSPQHYVDMANRAFDAATRFRPETRGPEIISFFWEVASNKPLMVAS